jgi:hypothetical protein
LASLIDIISAMLVGSILLLVSIKAMDAGLQQFVNHNTDAIAQDELIGMTEIIQNDLRKMGYGIPEADQASIIQSAQSANIQFLSILNSADEIPDTVDYLVAELDTITFVDTLMVLYGITRTVKISGSSTVSGIVGVITNNDIFSYLDQMGEETAVVQSIKMVEVTLVAMNPNVYLSDEVIAANNAVDRMVEIQKLITGSYWRQTRVISKNLRR